MSDLVFHTSCRVLVLRRQSVDQTSHARVLVALGQALSPHVSAACHKLHSVDEAGSATGGEPGHRPWRITVFLWFSSGKKYPDQCLLRSQWNSCISGSPGADCACWGQGRDGEELGADISWALTLCQALPCMCYLYDPCNSPSDKSNITNPVSVKDTQYREEGNQDLNSGSPIPEPIFLTIHHRCCHN